MNCRQMVKELRDAIRSTTWPGGGTDKVIGTSCYVVSDMTADNTPDRVPFALLKVGTGTPDPDDPNGIEIQEFDLILATVIEGDPHGQGAVLGGPRMRGEGSSSGRGILDLQVPILAAIGKMTGADGAAITATAAGHAVVSKFDGDEIGTRAYTIRCLCHVAATYEAPQNLVVTDNADSTAGVAWTAPSARHDFVEVVVRRASGATAPASETSGTEAYRGTATSFTDASGTGQFSWAVFAGYSDTESGHSESYSSQVTGTTRTVTVT